MIVLNPHPLLNHQPQRWQCQLLLHPLCLQQVKSKVCLKKIGVSGTLQAEVRTLRYGQAVVRLQIVEITSDDVMKRVPVQFSRPGLAVYYSYFTLHYASISRLFSSHLNLFSLFQQASLKINHKSLNHKSIVSL